MNLQTIWNELQSLKRKVNCSICNSGSGEGETASPGGNLGSIQFNDGSGGFSGSDGLSYDPDGFSGLIANPGFTATDGTDFAQAGTIYDGGEFTYISFGGAGSVPAYLNLQQGGGLALNDSYINFDLSAVVGSRTIIFPDSDGTIVLDNSPAFTGTVFIEDSAEPTTPTGGGVIYVEAGALKYKGSSGTVTTLGNP